MNKSQAAPLSRVSANIHLVPDWLYRRLKSEGQPVSILADAEKSANILSDEDIIYYLNGIGSILSQRTILDLFCDGLGVCYVVKGCFQAPNTVIDLLETVAHVQMTELQRHYKEKYPERFGHIVMGHYLRGPDSDVDLTGSFHATFDVIPEGGDIYVTYGLKAGHRLPHAERDFCKTLLKAIEPYTPRENLRASGLYRRAIK